MDYKKKGANNKPTRMILGAMIIKHKLNLGEAETFEAIRENHYMQYMCSSSEFTLCVTLRMPSINCPLGQDLYEQGKLGTAQ